MAYLNWFSVTVLSTLALGTVNANAADVKEINFVEAVHNLGYINLYVGQHAGIFEKNGLKLNLSAAGGDTQAFAAVLGKSSPFAIGDATMVQMSREAGGPGIVVGTVVQRAHYFGVSKNLPVLTDPKQFKGLTVVTSPEPNTNFSVTKKLLLDNGLKPQVDTKILEVNPGTEIGAMLAGQADMAVAYQPSVAAAESQGAKVVFDFSNYVGPFCNTGIMVLPEYAKENPDIVAGSGDVVRGSRPSRLRRPRLRQEGGAPGVSRSAGRRRRQGDRRRDQVSDSGRDRRHAGGRSGTTSWRCRNSSAT